MELFILLLFAAGLAFIPSTIAKQKGRDPALWWVYGFFLFLIALIHALLMESVAAAPNDARAVSPLRTCPYCAEPVQRAATICKHCRSPLQPDVTTAIQPASSSPPAPPPDKRDLIDEVWWLADGSFITLMKDGTAVSYANGSFQTFTSMASWREETGNASTPLLDPPVDRKAEFYSAFRNKHETPSAASTIHLDPAKVVEDIWRGPNGSFVTSMKSGETIAQLAGEYYTFPSLDEWRWRSSNQDLELTRASADEQIKFFQTIGAQYGLLKAQ